MNRSEKSKSAALKRQKRHSRLLSPTIRMIKPACHVATEIFEVLASGSKSFRRSQKNHLEAKLLETEPVRKDSRLLLNCWKLHRSEKTQSAAVTWSGWSSPRATSPRKSSRCLRLAAKTLGGHKKTTWKLSCWKLNGSDKTQLPAFKLLEKNPFRKDTVGCLIGPDDETRMPRRHGNLGGACVWQQKL